jgi:hypothetical protein
MTADEFVSALKQATPSFEEMVLNGEVLEYAQRFSRNRTVAPRPKPLVMGYKVSPLFTELFSRYDLSKLVISYFTFFDQPVFHDHRWFFGGDGGERLFVDPDTQEICREEAPATDELPGLYIEGGYAKDFDHFMAALLVVAEYYGLYNMDTPGSIRIDYAIRAANAAGGKQYKGFLAYDIDNDAYEQALDAS